MNDKHLVAMAKLAAAVCRCLPVALLGAAALCGLVGLAMS